MVCYENVLTLRVKKNAVKDVVTNMLSLSAQ
jgi:hypothetical protein